MSVDMKNVKYIWANKYEKAINLSGASGFDVSYVSLYDWEIAWLDENFPNWREEIIIITRTRPYERPTYTVQFAYFNSSGTQLFTSSKVSGLYQLGDIQGPTSGDTTAYTRAWYVSSNLRYNGYNRIRIEWQKSTTDWSNYVDTHHFVKKIEDSNNNVLWANARYLYRRLEYIESTTNTATNQFNIQFDFYCALTSSNYNHLDIDFQLTKATFNQSTGQYYGGIASMNGLDCRIGYSDNWTSTFTTYVNGSGTKADITSSAWNTNRHLISIYRGRCYVDSIDRGACLAANTGSGHNISIFNQKYDGSQWNILGKFYKLEVYNTQSGTSYYHRVFPCQRKSDGVIGVYDTITGRFYTNSGTGTFTAGPVVDEYWDLTAPE